MNSIRQIQELNKRELEAGVTPEGSWHADYRDTAFIYIGGLPFGLTEGDVVTIFSQYGEPVYVNLVRDKETGKSKGFAFLKYEDQRSCDLAVDNLSGATVGGRTLRVDHTRYKRKDDEELRDNTYGDQVQDANGTDSESEEEQRPMIKEERELAQLLKDQDDDDPMKAYMIQDKREEVEKALKALKMDKPSKSHHRSRRHRDRSNDRRERKHRHHRDDPKDVKENRSRRGDTGDEQEARYRKRRSNGDDEERSDRRRRSSREPGERRRQRSRERSKDDLSRRYRRRSDSEERVERSHRRHKRSNSPRRD